MSTFSLALQRICCQFCTNFPTFFLLVSGFRPIPTHRKDIPPLYKQWSLSTATAPQPPRHSTLRPVAATQKNCYITLPLTISQRPVTAIRSCPLADKYPFIPQHTRRNAQASFLNEGTFSLTHLAQKKAHSNRASRHTQPHLQKSINPLHLRRSPNTNKKAQRFYSLRLFLISRV